MKFVQVLRIFFFSEKNKFRAVSSIKKFLETYEVTVASAKLCEIECLDAVPFLKFYFFYGSVNNKKRNKCSRLLVFNLRLGEMTHANDIYLITM